MNRLPAAAARPTPSSKLSPGFTLVELLVATVVLSVGLLALTSAGAAIVKLESRGGRLSRVAALAETRLELVRVERCAATSGSGEIGRLQERWSVIHSAPSTFTVVDSVSDNDGAGSTPRRVDVFRSAVPC